MTEQEIDALEGEALAREVLRCVVQPDECHPVGVTRAIENERAQWWFIRQIEAAMAKRRYYMTLGSPWHMAGGYPLDDQWACHFAPHGGMSATFSHAPVAWVAVGRAALTALAKEQGDATQAAGG